jgi:uncharacterized protein with von Willebrand factor type A (vWA) domain
VTRQPEHALAAAAVALGRALRDAGVATTVDSSIALRRALEEIDLCSRVQMYWAARAVLVKRPEEVVAFDATFERFWSGLDLRADAVGAQHAESDARMPGPQHGGESLPQFRTEGRSSQLVDGQPSRATQEIPAAGSEDAGAEETRDRRGVLAAFSPDDAPGEDVPLRYGERELLAVKRLADELRRAVPERRSRRLRPARRGGRLDVRRTVGRSMATDGEALRPAFDAPSRRPRRLLVVCDVSGSMERYSRLLLASLEAVARCGVKAETFVFATRLTRLTGALAGRDAARALAEARAAVPDWSGGTRIGPALRELNSVYGRRGFARGAIAIVVSDGWDRADPALLAREVERLQLQARRLVWLNPRPLELAGQPLAVGLRAALPFVDDYVSGLDPRALAGLGRLIAGVDGGRPARRQRPLGLALR